jgi:hypothetical protein
VSTIDTPQSNRATTEHHLAAFLYQTYNESNFNSFNRQYTPECVPCPDFNKIGTSAFPTFFPCLPDWSFLIDEYNRNVGQRPHGAKGLSAQAACPLVRSPLVDNTHTHTHSHSHTHTYIVCLCSSGRRERRRGREDRFLLQLTLPDEAHTKYGAPAQVQKQTPPELTRLRPKPTTTSTGDMARSRWSSISWRAKVALRSTSNCSNSRSRPPGTCETNACAAHPRSL